MPGSPPCPILGRQKEEEAIQPNQNKEEWFLTNQEVGLFKGF